MPEDRLEKARFERVSETGELVFSLGGREFAISVDDTLERGILEAKQVSQETQQLRQPHQQSTLPISQIQSLIRAGADPARVAERYDLSETLVRRFSAAVETEKQYAIEQFFTVPAPKDSKVRTVSELVERTLATASIGMESVTWKSTRRGLEPWHIVARFTSAGREIHAEWTWNMHDNSVVCLNGAARKLLGEHNPKSETADKSKVAAPELPGNSVRSARIERAVSAWAAPEPSIPAARPEIARPGTSTGTSTGSMPPIDFATSGSMPAVRDVPAMAPPVSAGPVSAGTVSAGPAASPSVHAQPIAQPQAQPIATQPAATQPAAIMKRQQPMSASYPRSSDEISDKTVRRGPNAQLVATEEDRAAEAAKARARTNAEAKPAKRKSGRSAVPSWDEILFGD